RLLASADTVWAHTDGWLEDPTLVRQRFSACYPPVDDRVEGWIFTGLLRRNFITADAVIARRDVVSGLGGFDETIRGTEAWGRWREAAGYFAASLRLWPLQRGAWLRWLRGRAAAPSGP